MENSAKGNIQAKVQPDITRGITVIMSLILNMELFYKRKAGGQKGIFKEIFTYTVVEYGRKDTEGLWQHLYAKFVESDFAHFFLNMDCKCQRAFLDNISGTMESFSPLAMPLDLELPEITEWEKIGSEIFKEKPFDQELVRRFASSMNKISEWDAYPQDLVWIRKALLYFNNNGIEDSEYKGERFGNFKNWAAYYKLIPPTSRLSMVEYLMNYK